jgi:dihydroorotase
MPARINSIKSNSFIILNTCVWNHDEVNSKVDVYVNSGIVTKISPHSAQTLQSNQISIDGSGLVLIPAGVDAQVHLRVPGQPTKETSTSGLWAAVHGGVGALLTMPNTKPVVDSKGACELAHHELKGAISDTGVKVLLSAAITMGQKGTQVVDFENLARAGVSAFTDDGVGVPSDAVMLEALKGAARVNLPLLQHAEVPGHGGVLHKSKLQESLGGPSYPSSAEYEMVARDIKLLESIPNAKYHVLHVSTKETLDLVSAARRKGLNVTCEASPHHLFFNCDDIKDKVTSFKMNPPLRSKEDQTSLINALSDGRCQFIATDHAPHELDVKSDNFKTSAFGTTGLETSLKVLIWLWQAQKLSSQRFVEVWSTGPAKFLRIESEYGAIKEGFPFNAVLIDPKAPDQLVLESDFIGLSKNSCFIGSKLPGKIHATILRDQIHRMN